MCKKEKTLWSNLIVIIIVLLVSLWSIKPVPVDALGNPQKTQTAVAATQTAAASTPTSIPPTATPPLPTATPLPGNTPTPGITPTGQPVATPTQISGAVYLPPEYEYGDLDLSGHEKVVLTPGKYIFNSIKVSGQGEIVIQAYDVDGDGKVDPVEIWVRGDLDIGGSGFVNSGTNPKATDLFIFGEGSGHDWKIHGNGLFYGAVYAPDENISICGGGAWGDVYGSIIGNNITFNGTDTHVHYDEALSRIGGGEVYLGLDKDNISWVIELQ